MKKEIIAIGLGAVLAMFQTADVKAADTKEIAAARSWLQQNASGLEDGVLDAAAKEGKLMLYCLVSSCPQPLVDAFHKTFPFIKVQVYRASGGALAERFASESRAKRGMADVVMNSSAIVLDQFAKEGFLLNWTPPSGELVPKAFRHDGYWYGIGLLHMGMAWNTTKVTPEEEQWLRSVGSWKDIANPAFKGRTALTHVRAGGTSQLVYYYLKETVGASYMENLKTNLEPVIFDSINTLSERLVSGEYSYTPLGPIDIGVLNDMVGRGAPIGWNFPEPALALAYSAAISQGAPHQNAAKLFMAWSTTLTGQSAYVNTVGLGPMRSDVTDNRPITRSQYYKLPKTVYEADWSLISKDLGGIMAEFKRVFND